VHPANLCHNVPGYKNNHSWRFANSGLPPAFSRPQAPNAKKPIKTMKCTNLFFRLARSASSLAALALANPSAHAAPTVWNVNMAGTAAAYTITTSENYFGAALENTANSTWNNIVTSANGIALADSTGSNSAGVTLDLSALQGANPISPYGPGVPGTGDEIFNSYLSGGNVTSNMTIKNLPAGSYDLIIYADWYWGGSVAYPVTQTVGTGLAGTVYVNTPEIQIAGGLVQDTDLGNNGSIKGNWMRINGLTPTAGELGFRLGDGANGPYNGFQLVNTIPEPSSVLLGGLGVLALLRRRR
jgi:hypothetical protein